MNNARLAQIQEQFELPAFRVKQLRTAFFEQDIDCWDDVSTLSKDLRAKLAAAHPILAVKPEVVQVSADGRAHKAAFSLSDGRQIESVLLNPKPGLWSTCISSQAGCALKCTFCATGTMGFYRHLTSEEITDQVLFWRQYIRRNDMDARLKNIVYMGMGEPLHNRKAVFASIESLTDPYTFNIGARNVSVSTSGLIPPIIELGDRFPQVNLAISLHAANDELRLKMMPINKPYPLAKLAEALKAHMDKTNRKVFFEYILLEDENDSPAHAQELADYLKAFQRPNLVHANLIVYNKTDTEADHNESPRERARAFREALESNGVSATIRRNLGRDIDGACGQLALKEAGHRPGVQTLEISEAGLFGE
jgi:23S rRNA (adenine(2503)-C(2))-methyltransferase